MSTFQHWPPRDEVYREVAARLDGATVHRTPYGQTSLQKRGARWIVTLRPQPMQATYSTLVLAPFHNPDGFRFIVRDEGMLDGVWKTLGFLQDVEVGDGAFDDRFILKGFPAARVRMLLTDDLRRLLSDQPKLTLGVRSSLFHQEPGAPLPTSVDVLYFYLKGEIRDVERLVRLVEIAEMVLERVVPDPPGWETDVDELIRRLQAPGGQFRPSYTQVTMWDGDPLRRDAADRLGRLGDDRAVDPLIAALEDSDDRLVAAAIEALARIGHSDAVPHIVRLLGAVEREVDGRTLAGYATAALSELREAGLADAFERAIAGTPDALPAAAGPFRDEVVAALMEIVGSTDFGARPHAARALGAMGANEALPLLRSKSTAWGMQTKLTRAAEEAVAEIEARASLPRAARAAPRPVDTHPRPAESPGRNTGTLPRPSK